MTNNDNDRAQAPNRKGQAKLVAVVVALVVVAALVIDNTQKVKLGWVFGDGEAPLIVALVAALLVGTLTGFGFGRRRYKQ